MTVTPAVPETGVLSPGEFLPSPVQVTSSLIHQEIGALLGPLVSPLLQDESGNLDLNKFPRESFAQFQKFLLTQVQIDGIAFSQHLLDSYHRVLKDPKHEPILRELYQSSLGKGPSLPKEQEAGLKQNPIEQLESLHELTADLLKVSPERFASHHLRSQQGQARLARVLKDIQGYGHETRADLVKGIALAARGFGTGRAAYRKLNAEISVWNYINASVTQEELDRATHIALGMLQEVGQFQDEGLALFKRSLKHPEQVTRLVGLEKELQRTLSDTAIQEKATFVQFNKDRYDPKTVLAVKLDQLWLTLIDEDRWKDSGSLKTAKNAAFLLQEIEGYREQLKEIQSEPEFLKLTEQIRTLLKGGLGVTGEGTWRSLKDFTATSTVAQLFQDLPEVHRSPYDGLLQYVEEIHHANDMGETIELNINELAPLNSDLGQLPNFAKNSPTPLNLIPNRRKGSASRQAGGNFRPPTGGTKLASRPQGGIAQVIQAQYKIDRNQPEKLNPEALKTLDPKKFQAAKIQLIHGLKQTKLSLWYQYKQHKALSRGISQAAKLIGKGDIVEIQAGQEAIDRLLNQTKQAGNPEQLKTVIQNLQGQLKEDGKLHQAMVAAEMDGTEQLIGLGQTILIILATRRMGKELNGLSSMISETSAGQRLTRMAQSLSNFRAGQFFHRGIQNNVLAWRVTKGFAMGSWLATAENAVAAATDEVKPDGHHLASWAKDALATGAAMGGFTTAASYLGRSMHQNLFKRFLGRYLGDSRGTFHLLGDVAIETGEEFFDAALRARLEDSDAAIGFDQFREIAVLSGLGGFAKTGLVAEMLRGKPNKPVAPTSDETQVKVPEKPRPQAREASPRSHSLPKPSLGPNVSKGLYLHGPGLMEALEMNQAPANDNQDRTLHDDMAEVLVGPWDSAQRFMDDAFRFEAYVFAAEFLNRLEEKSTYITDQKLLEQYLQEEEQGIKENCPTLKEQREFWRLVRVVLERVDPKIHPEAARALKVMQPYFPKSPEGYHSFSILGGVGAFLDLGQSLGLNSIEGGPFLSYPGPWNDLLTALGITLVGMVWSTLQKKEAIDELKKMTATNPFPLGDENLPQLKEMRDSLVKQLEESGAQVQRYPVAQLVNESLFFEEFAPTWFQKLLQENPEGKIDPDHTDWTVTEVALSPEVFNSLVGESRYHSDIGFTIDILNVLEQEMDFPLQTFIKKDSGNQILRFFPDELLFRAPNEMFGSHAVSMVPVAGLVSLEEMHAFAKKHQRPVALAQTPQTLHETEGVNPYTVALHDLYHTLKLSKFSRANRSVQNKVAKVLLEFRDESEDGKTIGYALERLIDGDFDVRPKLTSLWLLLDVNQLPKRTIQKIYRRLQEEISDDPIGRAFLETMEIHLRRKLDLEPPEDP